MAFRKLFRRAANAPDSLPSPNPLTLGVSSSRKPNNEERYSQPAGLPLRDSPLLRQSSSTLLLLNLSGSSGALLLPDVPAQLVPIVTLMNVQQNRLYREGEFQIPVSLLREWTAVRGLLRGCELTIWNPSEAGDSAHINLIDAIVRVQAEELQIVILTDSMVYYTIRCSSKRRFEAWFAAIKLSQFEFVALNEAYTATVVAWKGVTLPDISYLLSSKHGALDWVDIRLPHLLSKWVRCYMVVLDTKKKRNLELYTSETISKKNLIASIDEASAVYNVYPQTLKVVDENAMMKIHGAVRVNEKYLNLFAHGSRRLVSGSSSRSISSSLRIRSKGNLSPMIAPLSQMTPPRLPFRRGHGKSDSVSLTGSSISLDESAFQDFQSLYILPRPHSAVRNVETMIRAFFPIISCFLLYGRPDQLLSLKKDPNSMVFAMPVLPRALYLALSEAETVIRDGGFDTHFTTGLAEFLYWQLAFKGLLLTMINRPQGYTGCGHIRDSGTAESQGATPTNRASMRFPGGSQSPLMAMPSSPSIPRMLSPLGQQSYQALSVGQQSYKVLSVGQISPSATALFGHALTSKPLPSSPRYQTFPLGLGAELETHTRTLAPVLKLSSLGLELPSLPTARDRHPFAPRGLSTSDLASSLSSPGPYSSRLSTSATKLILARSNGTLLPGYSQEKAPILIV